ncbi:putative protein kinase RLK-Pelle-LRR-XII-1 family [Rosa chinensis]|uniref:non-specific serine/threonine protein kinase n=1 Tax=Rosa chinensis TaxID=74649 RepID=A0A2P6SCL6_ROSCH|nr:putative protein kinase RLK-Pelle-LRR-XII-1 family [Rosa chinensis]
MGGALVMKLVLIYSLVLNSMSIFYCSSMQLNHPRLEGNEMDRLALLAIKAQIQHDPNRVTSSWNETLHFCLWHGVTCSRRHRRSTILTGEIPPSLGNLSSLERFDATQNNFEGSIPSSLCQLKKLTVFYFGINRLSSIIPSCIYNLSSIVEFKVSQNQFQGSLPSNLSNAFPNLQFFSVAENQFIGAIPWSISNATNLVWFQCSSNKLTGQVPNLQNLHNLMIFSVYDNNLGSGKHGDLSFVLELINAKQLTLLDFGRNNFGGTLPKSISNLSTNLQLFMVDENQLHGSIPTGLGNFVNLQVLAMERNSFTGNIPTNIGKVSGLGELFLNNNQLSRSIPSSLGNLTLLTLLVLDENNLEGSIIPSGLWNYRYLLGLDLSRNNLNGTIPTQVFGLSSVSRYLRLDRNYFTGSLPMEIGNLKNLGILDISNNLLSGQLPSSLGSCESLEELYLQGNFFLGPIPSSMKELRGIRDLDLSRNNLSGDIPQFLENLNLEYLNLSFNQFWGAVPTSGVFKNASATTVAGNAKLCGGMASLRPPNETDDLFSLRVHSFGTGYVLSLLLLGKKRKETNLSTLGNSVLQVSYATLLKATEGFSSANLIGVGAFGSVYKGILADDRVVVAVKVLNMLHRGVAKSFMAKYEAFRNIRHRNLVKILTTCSNIDFGGNDFKALVY